MHPASPLRPESIEDRALAIIERVTQAIDFVFDSRSAELVARSWRLSTRSEAFSFSSSSNDFNPVRTDVICFSANRNRW